MAIDTILEYKEEVHRQITTLPVVLNYVTTLEKRLADAEKASDSFLRTIIRMTKKYGSLADMGIFDDKEGD